MICLVVFTVALGLQTVSGSGSARASADQGKTSSAWDTAGSEVAAIPPVLRNEDLPDSGILRLPGGPAPVLRTPPPLPPISSPNPSPSAPEPLPFGSLPFRPLPLSETPLLPAPNSEEHPPAGPGGNRRTAPLPLPKRFLPADFSADSGLFCQKRIGEWTQPDAYNLLGEPTRERPSLSEGAENGRIYAFNDPTGHYRELELDFEADTGLLRTVFVYPWRMTWADCRRLWGARVNTTTTEKGRSFHSYLNRRLDVLVDPDGKVISLGLY